MSEHIEIKGECNFWHMPYEWAGGFAYCCRCKRINDSLILQLHNGWNGDWIKCVCPKCKKTIWTAELKGKTGDYRDIIDPKEDVKCSGCKRKTNRFDSYSLCYYNKKNFIFCSKKCNDKWDKKVIREKKGVRK